MKIILRILSVLLTCFFLLSNNGISLILHHCLSCDATDYFFATYPGKIEHHHHDNDHSLHTNCCNTFKENEHENHHSCGILAGDNECCETELQYLKTDYEVLLKGYSGKLLQPVFLPLDLSSGDISCSESIAGKLMQDYSDPPPKLVSKAFIIFTNQFKLC